jgi:hypothetical protein
MTHRRPRNPSVSGKLLAFQGPAKTLYFGGSYGLGEAIQVTRKKTASSPPRSASAKPSKDFDGVFRALKQILKPYEKDLQVLPYKPEYYCLVTRRAVQKGKPVWFAAIRMGKNYVSYHFMPLYRNATMQKRIPPELKKRMQGKACFNFSEVDPALFRQLSELTAAGFEGYRALKYV